MHWFCKTGDFSLLRLKRYKHTSFWMWGGVLVAQLATAEPNVTAWGNHQIFVPANASNVVAITAGGFHNIALRGDGSVVSWKDIGGPVAGAVEELQHAVAVAAGYAHSLAVRADGSVAAWGNNVNVEQEWTGQAVVPEGLCGVVAVAGGSAHSLALREDGRVVAWGENKFSQALVPPGLSNVVALAAGWRHSLALRADGSVVAWGCNLEGQAAVPAAASNVVALAGGLFHTLALRADGSVLAWGGNLEGCDQRWVGQSTVPSGLSNVVAVTAGHYFSVALRADGSIMAWGDDAYEQAHVPDNLHHVVAVSSSSSHTLALQGEGKPVLSPHVKRLTLPQGSPFFLRAQATGAPPLAYRWQKDGAPLAGATNALLHWRATQAREAGAYRCIVTNAQGVTTGAVLNVAVEMSRSVTHAPAAARP